MINQGLSHPRPSCVQIYLDFDKFIIRVGRPGSLRVITSPKYMQLHRAELKIVSSPQ